MNKVTAGIFSLHEGKVCRICGKADCPGCQLMTHMLVGKRVNHKGNHCLVIGTTAGITVGDLPRLLLKYKPFPGKQMKTTVAAVEEVSFDEKTVF